MGINSGIFRGFRSVIRYDAPSFWESYERSNIHGGNTMRKIASLLIAAALPVILLAGCAGSVPAGTVGTTPPGTSVPLTQVTTPAHTQPPAGQNGCTGILERIWAEYDAQERFASYGGTVEQAVSDAPGPLDVKNAEELTARYLIPQELHAQMQEAASLVHMMNSNIFTGVTVRLSEGVDGKTFAQSWRNVIQKNRWICGQPDRLLMVALRDGHLLMAFGSGEAVALFRSKLAAAYTDVDILYEEAIVS